MQMFSFLFHNWVEFKQKPLAVGGAPGADKTCPESSREIKDSSSPVSSPQSRLWWSEAIPDCAVSGRRHGVAGEDGGRIRVEIIGNTRRIKCRFKAKSLAVNITDSFFTVATVHPASY